MRLIYLASPYSSLSEKVKEERRNAAAKALAYFSTTAPDLCLYSPITHWHSVAKHFDIPSDFSFWRERDFFMIRKSSGVFVLTIPGWEESFGVSQEIEFAKDIGKPVYMVDPEESYVLMDRIPSDTNVSKD